MLRAISGKTGNLAPIRPDMTNVTFQEKKGYGFGVDRLDVSNSKDKSDKLIRLCLIPKGAAIPVSGIFYLNQWKVSTAGNPLISLLYLV
jgi:hypothetical protein